MDERSSLERRVAALERQVAELLRRQGSAPARPPRPETRSPPVEERDRPFFRDGAERAARRSAAGAGAAPPSAAPGPDAGERSAGAASLEEEGEKWLGRVGIGFVVLAFAFLLKLSFDRGWITPALRLASGFASGLVLLVVGLRLETERQKLAQALLGGGIALLYLTAFGGSQLYALLPLWVAFSIMATTAVLAIVLSDRQDSPGLAIMGVVGGLATPFLLEVAVGNSGAVALYGTATTAGGRVVEV